VARASARLPTSRTRRRRILRRTLIGSVIVHLILVALFLLAPRVPPPDTAPAEPGIAMQFETPRPKGAASDTPQPDAGEGIEAPIPSPVQNAPPATPSPPTPELPPDAAPPDAQAPPVPPPPDVAPAGATPPDAAALPDTPAAEAPTAPAPETPEADMQVNAGPLAELFNLQPVPVPQPRPLSPPPAPTPRPRATRPAPAFPTPREWAFTPAAPGGGSPARGASRGLNLSFSPRIRGGGGGQSSPDFSAPDAGPDWLNELHAWWDRHGYFPREAAEAGEQGTLSLHLMVNHDGRVAAARLTMQSGSVWLDQGALALFRDARLPALPPQTEKPQIPVDLTIHYILR